MANFGILNLASNSRVPNSPLEPVSSFDVGNCKGKTTLGWRCYTVVTGEPLDLAIHRVNFKAKYSCYGPFSWQPPCERDSSCGWKGVRKMKRQAKKKLKRMETLKVKKRMKRLLVEKNKESDNRQRDKLLVLQKWRNLKIRPENETEDIKTRNQIWEWLSTYRWIPKISKKENNGMKITNLSSAEKNQEMDRSSTCQHST